MKKNLLQIIKEEVQNWFKDYDQSSLDAYSDKYLSTNAPPPAATPAQPQQPAQPQANGQLIGYVTKEWSRTIPTPIPIYKNPQSLQGIGNGARGVLMANGDFYLTPSAKAFHDNILDVLGEKGIIPVATAYHYYDNLPEEFVAVQRVFNTNTFSQSAAYDEFPEYYNQIFAVGDQKQPFSFKPVPVSKEVSEMESPLDPNMQISYRPEGYVDNNLYENSKKK
jgi:hypothetical protein